MATKVNPPPGPRGLPLLGNVLDIPQTRMSEHFAKMRSVSRCMVAA